MAYKQGGFGGEFNPGAVAGTSAANENVTQKWIWKPPVAPVNYKSKR